MHPEQLENLERVSQRIGACILDWCRRRVAEGRDEFHMSDLAAHVCYMVPGCSPDSPSRVLRMLRARGEVKYVVVSRAESLYRLGIGQPSLFV